MYQSTPYRPSLNRLLRDTHQALLDAIETEEEPDQAQLVSLVIAIEDLLKTRLFITKADDLIADAAEVIPATEYWQSMQRQGFLA